MLTLFDSTAALERRDELHEARLLILIHAFVKSDEHKTIDGLTKLAKLDFLLRYPTYLERALEAKHKDPTRAAVQEHERLNIESTMVRYRYGPWDFRYRRFANVLIAKGLVYSSMERRTVKLGLTADGIELASKFSRLDDFVLITRRARLLAQYFDNTASNLVKFVYATFPEVASLRLGDRIQ